MIRDDLVTHEQYAKLFDEMHPGFFERDYIRNMTEDEPASEMLLRLQSFDEKIYDRKFPENISFGYYKDDLNKLHEAVNAVIPHWVPFFDGKSRVYCGFEEGKIACFCMIEDFGEHFVAGMKWKIGGPGCVGTLPQFRNRGLGLVMVRNVTKILRDEGYDYSYIHYTYETGWYSKLGYKTFLRWNRNGIVKENNE